MKTSWNFFLLVATLFLSISCSKDSPSKEEDDSETGDTITIDQDAIPRDHTIGVYYYPWHHSDFHGAEYLRKCLSPAQQPVLGEYDDRSTAVLKSHFDWCRYAGIYMLACSWWGPELGEDITTRDFMLPHTDLGTLKICLHYETAARTDNFTSLANVGPDIAYMADHYFNHPNYYRINNKPVVIIYLTRVLQSKGLLASFATQMRNSAKNKGFELYIIGDHAFGSTPYSGGDINKLDAITNYDVYGATGIQGYAGVSGASHYTSDQSDWRTLAHSIGIDFIPAVSPGFNDKGVREGHEPLSRKLSETHEFGSLFREYLMGAKPQADTATKKLIMITSWNEWHEDTQIEPVLKADSTNLDTSGSGNDYTRGLHYQGYDSLYLDILRDMFISE